MGFSPSASVDICVGSGSGSGTLFFQVKRRELEGGRSSTDGREVPSGMGEMMDAQLALSSLPRPP